MLASADYGHDAIDGSYSTLSAGSREVRKAAIKLHSARLSLTTAVPVAFGSACVTPFFGAEVLHFSRPAFGETSGGGRIRLESVSDTRRSAFVGLSAETSVTNEDGMTLAIQGELLYRRTFGDANRRTSRWQFYGAEGSDRIESGIGHDRIEANVSMQLFRTQDLRVGVALGTTHSSGASGWTGSLQARWQW